MGGLLFTGHSSCVCALYGVCIMRAEDDADGDLATLDRLTTSLRQGQTAASVECLDLMIHALEREATTTMTSSMTSREATMVTSSMTSRGAGHVSQLTNLVSTACTDIEQQMQVRFDILPSPTVDSSNSNARVLGTATLTSPSHWNFGRPKKRFAGKKKSI